MLGWIALLYQFVVTSKISFKMNFKVFGIGTALVTVLVAYNMLQKAPLVVIGYFVLPVFVWMIVLANNEGQTLQKFITNKNQVLIGLAIVIAAELLVFSFFQRKILSLMLLGYVGAITAYSIKRKLQPKLKILKYFSSAVCLGIFPLLKVVEKDTKNSILL